MRRRNGMADEERDASRSWEPMKLTYVGEVGQVLKTGGGKDSTDVPEPGEVATKPPGQ
jgi:hypothetical protein